MAFVWCMFPTPVIPVSQPPLKSTRLRRPGMSAEIAARKHSMPECHKRAHPARVRTKEVNAMAKSWQVAGTYFASCSCYAPCSCVCLSQPSDGDCAVRVGSVSSLMQEAAVRQLDAATVGNPAHC